MACGIKIRYYLCGMANLTHPALAPLKQRFPGTKFLVAEFRGQTTVIVPKVAILEVCTFLRDDPVLRFDQLTDLSATDYLNYPGAKHRFSVNYILSSLPNNQRLFLKCYLDPTRDTAPGTAPSDENALETGDPGLVIDSVIGVWPGADWMEREAYDLMGIIFRGHPDLRRIFTWNGFGSHPLRKDYPVRGVGERERYKIVARDGA